MHSKMQPISKHLQGYTDLILMHMLAAVCMLPIPIDLAAAVRVPIPMHIVAATRGDHKAIDSPTRVDVYLCAQVL